MRPWRRLIADDSGSAPLEFLGAGVVLLVPLFYLVLTLGHIQAQSLGVEAVARQVARVVAQDPSQAANMPALAASIAQQYGVDPGLLSVAMDCGGAPQCPEPGGIVTISVTATVGLPFIPAMIGDAGPIGVGVSAHSSQKVSQYVIEP